MKGIIFNIFLYQNKNKNNNNKIYLYSKKNQADDLGYEYHILGLNENNELIDRQIPNIIQIFENNDIDIKEIRIDNNNPEFLKFLEYYKLVHSEIEKGKKH